MAYTKKPEPTINGFQELWDSIGHPTIERLIAGIQSKRTTREEILNLTKEMRESHSLLDVELNRLAAFAHDYNGKWATKKTYDFGTTEQLQHKIRSQLKRWLEILKITSPRYKPSLEGRTEQESYFKASYLTNRPFEQDIWGPALYETLVYDLHAEVEILVKHLHEGEILCKEILKKERDIDNDPEWKEQLYDEQYKDIEERSQNLIKERYNSGITSTANPLYQTMMSSPSEYDYKVAYFHKPNESSFTSYVVDFSALKLLNCNINPTEHQLWGDDINKIKDFRLALGHLNALLEIQKGKFDKYSILEFIKWCKVKISTIKRQDNERILYEYINKVYQGPYRWPSWSTIFELNKIAKNEEIACMEYATKFERKLNRLKVDIKYDSQNSAPLKS